MPMQSGENGQQGSAFHDEPEDNDKGVFIKPISKMDNKAVRLATGR